jgi:hypothetical protein
MGPVALRAAERLATRQTLAAAGTATRPPSPTQLRTQSQALTCLNGTSVRYLSGLATSGTGVKVEVELLQTDGKGNFTYRAHTNDGASISNPTVAGTYGVASNGRLNSLGRLGPGFLRGGHQRRLRHRHQHERHLQLFRTAIDRTIQQRLTQRKLLLRSGGAVSRGLPIPNGRIHSGRAGNVSGTSDAINGSSDALSPAQTWSGQTYAISSTGRGTLSYNGDVVSILYVISPTSWVSIDIGPPNNVPSYPELQLSLE